MIEEMILIKESSCCFSAIHMTVDAKLVSLLTSESMHSYFLVSFNRCDFLFLRGTQNLCICHKQMQRSWLVCLQVLGEINQVELCHYCLCCVLFWHTQILWSAILRGVTNVIVMLYLLVVSMNVMIWKIINSDINIQHSYDTTNNKKFPPQQQAS